MTYYEAMRLLDKVRDGAQYPLHTINQALELTGDRSELHEGLRGEGMDPQVRPEEAGCRGIRSAAVVAGHDCRH